MAPDRVIAAKRREGGFTLMEVMIAVLLTAIAIIGMIALFRVNTTAASYSRHQTEASILAQDRLETIRTWPSTAVVAGSTTENTLNDLGKTVSGGRYTRVSTIAAASSQFSLTVAVSWDEDGTTKTVTVRGMR